MANDGAAFAADESTAKNSQAVERAGDVPKEFLIAQSLPKQERPELQQAPKPESQDKGVDSITILPGGGTITEYKPGSRDDKLARRIESSINGVFSSDLAFFEGRSDGLKHQSSVRDSQKFEELKEFNPEKNPDRIVAQMTTESGKKTTVERNYQNNQDGIKKEKTESATGDNLNGQITRQMQDGTTIEFDKRDGRVIRSRKFDATGALIPADKEAAPNIVDAAKLPNRVPVDSSTGGVDHVKRVQDQLDNMPEPVRKLLNDNGYKIIAADKVVDARPDLQNKAPRGYPPGATYENTSAIQDSNRKEIIIGDQYKSSANGQWYHDDRVESNTRHEVGHAVDAILGSKQALFGWGSPLSESVDFEKAYDADVAKIPLADQAKLQYLLQPGNTNGGKSETFAEVYAHIQGGASTADPVARALIGKYFTNTEKYIRDKLSTL